MIIGLGIDAVEISRFANWPTYTEARLLQIFSPVEIAYALLVPLKASERLAARFAAKEAAYKALASRMPVQITLIEFCKLVYIQNDSTGAPNLVANLAQLGLPLTLKLLVSITHTNALAIVLVVAELD